MTQRPSELRAAVNQRALKMRRTFPTRSAPELVVVLWQTWSGGLTSHSRVGGSNPTLSVHIVINQTLTDGWSGYAGCFNIELKRRHAVAETMR